MTQMKWLPILVDGKSLASGLLDILENANTPSQKHIIRLLPEIFSPEFHPDLVPKLLYVFPFSQFLQSTFIYMIIRLTVFF